MPQFPFKQTVSQDCNLALPVMKLRHAGRDVAGGDHVPAMLDAQVGHIHMECVRQQAAVTQAQAEVNIQETQQASVLDNVILMLTANSSSLQK